METNNLYALNLDEDNRILSVTLDEFAPTEQPRVETLPDGDISDYKYENGKYVYDPLPKPEKTVEPSQLDILEAQVTYTAMMTDTLLEV